MSKLNKLNQNQGQTQGLTLRGCWVDLKIKTLSINSKVYKYQKNSHRSSSAADPSLPPVARGQQHGPWGVEEINNIINDKYIWGLEINPLTRKKEKETCVSKTKLRLVAIVDKIKPRGLDE